MARMIPDNVRATLAQAAGTGDTSIYVRTGDGAQFEQDGTLSASNYVIATLVKVSGYRDIAWERVKVTARSTDTLTVTRSYGGDTALSFSAGDRIEARVDSSALTPPDKANTWTEAQAISNTLTLNRSDGAPVVEVIGTGQQPTIRLARYSTDSGQSYQIFRKSRGTEASPTAVATNDAVGGFMQQAYDGAAWRTIAEIRGIVENYTGSDNVSGAMSFMTRRTGAAGANTEALRISAAGYIGVGTSSPSTTLHVNGPIRCASYTVATVPSASTAGAGARIYVTNEAGGATGAESDGTNWRRYADRAIIS